MHPLVSVIVPTCDRADMVVRAVNSVLGQSYDNVEVIVVDDNPKNSQARIDTQKALDVFSSDLRVKYIKNEQPLGGSGARNIGIENASGEYISFLDDDDLYLKNKIKAQVEYMQAHNCDMCFSDVRIHDSKNNLIDYREHERYITSLENSELLKWHIMYSLTPTATYMYKTSAIKGIGGFKKVPVGQEFDLMLRTINSSIKIGFLPECGVVQYHHAGKRISVGGNKVNGEAIMYSLKQQYFYALNKKQKGFVKFRHYVVLAVACLRGGLYFQFVKNGALAFFASPLLLVTEFYSHRKRISKHKNDTLDWVE